MKTYILTHIHKYGATPILFRSKTLELRKDGIDEYEKKKLIEELKIDFNEDKEFIEVTEIGNWSDIIIIKF